MQAERMSGRAKLALAAPLSLGLWAVLPSAAHAAQTDDAAAYSYADIEFILSSFSLLVWGVLVMWMCAGFTMLESGSVRTKNASMICLKNVGIFSIAGLSYFFVGYNLMYVDVDGIVGTLQFLHGPTEAETTLFDGSVGRMDEVVGRGHASMSEWFFQMLFVATTASIVSGAILERVKVWVFWVFTLVMTSLIYPIVGAWVWGGGWLDERGFQDFAGSTVVHVTGGCAALAALLVVGPRRGKFAPDGSVKPTPPSNVLVVTLGVLILWLGWFGFNGGSQLSLSTPADAVVMSSVLTNTNLAAASGMLAAVIVARPIFGRLGLASSLNGALAGLVSITAGPNIAESWWAVIIGAVGGLLCTLATKIMEQIKLDDVVGAIPVHLVAGIWGTLASSIAAGANIGVQLLGVASVAAFVFVASLLTWIVIDLTAGTRVSANVEYAGQDLGELGIESHPEFVIVPEDFRDYQQPISRLFRRPHSGRHTSMDPRLESERWAPPPQRPVPEGAPPGQYPVPEGASPDWRPVPGVAPPGQYPVPEGASPDWRPVPGVASPGQYPVPEGASPDWRPVPGVASPGQYPVPEGASPDWRPVPGVASPGQYPVPEGASPGQYPVPEGASPGQRPVPEGASPDWCPVPEAPPPGWRD